MRNNCKVSRYGLHTEAAKRAWGWIARDASRHPESLTENAASIFWFFLTAWK
jgi:hypothetical protein